nr:hypothetical protein [Candidatus Sigynarchaeota archaeon]
MERTMETSDPKARTNEIETNEIVELLPSLIRYVRGNCLLIPRENDSYFVIKNNVVYFIKKRCMDCLHFRPNKGCGIGPDVKSICIIPEENQKGWTNLEQHKVHVHPMSLVLLAKVMTLIEDDLPAFIKEQIPPAFFDSSCKKYVHIKPIVYRMLVDLEKQEAQILKKISE